MSTDESGAAGAVYPIIQPAIDNLPPLDIRTVSRLSGTAVSTLNVQVQRGLYPWIEVGQQGRGRRFDPGSAMHICITGALIGLGLGAAQASGLALDIMRVVDLAQPDLYAVIGAKPDPAAGEIISPLPRPVWVVQAKTLGEVERTLGDQLPRNIIVLDISALVHRLIAAARTSVAPPADNDRVDE